MNKKAGGNNGLTVLHGKAWLLAAVCSVTVLAGAAGAPIVGINEDNENFFVTRPEEEMTEACAEAYIDSLAGGKITHVFMCPSGQRTSYDSKAWEPIWTLVNEPGGEIPPGVKVKSLPQTKRWAKNAKLLHDRGVDLYKVWIRRCRQRGLSPWLSPRMNDIHHVDWEWPQRNTTFWRTRTDLHCATNAIGRGPFCYAHQEVQDYVFSLMKELIDRYDMDGLELDFMRQARCFEEIDAIGQSHHMDRFIKRVKDYIGNEPFLMTYGDGVADVDINALIAFHREHGHIATLTGVQPEGRFGIMDLNGDTIQSFREKSKDDMGWINGGFMVLEPSVMNYIAGDEIVFEREPLERLAQDGQLDCYRHEGFWQCMDTLRDKEKLEKLIADKQAPWLL